MTKKEDQESDNESVATEDIVEPEITPEPVPDPFAEPVQVYEKPEPTIHLGVTPEPASVPVPKPKPKKQGRAPKQKTKPTKTDATLGALTKADLINLVTSQHDLLNRRALIDKEQEEFIKQKTTNKIGRTTTKEKRERTPKQIEATKRMVAARKAKRDALLSESKKEIVKEIDDSLADRVEEAVTNIILKPMRALTPERLKKVEILTEPKKKSRF